MAPSKAARLTGLLLLIIAFVTAVEPHRNASAAGATIDPSSCGAGSGNQSDYCDYAGSVGFVDVVIGPNSCNVLGSCINLGFGVQINAGGGSGSCNGDGACDGVGADLTTNIRTIAGGACNGEHACYFAGAADGASAIGAGACVGKDACAGVGYDGTAQIVAGSCLGTSACDSGLATNGTTKGGTLFVGANSCTVAQSCFQTAFNGFSTIGAGSCTATKACYQAGYSGTSSIGKGSCTSDSACLGVGSGTGGSSSIGDNSCSGTAACEFSGLQGSSKIGNYSCNAAGCSQAGITGGTSVIGNGSCNNNLGCNSNAGTIGDCVNNHEPFPPICPGTGTTPGPLATGSVQIRKLLLPFFDSGRFDLLLDNTKYAAAVGQNGDTGPVLVSLGDHTVGEAAVSPARLSNYGTAIFCQDPHTSGFVAYGFSSGLTVKVQPGDTIVCTIVNVRLARRFWWWF
jgi:hypothetical protein